MITKITHRRVWALALPIMLANASEPLLGLADTAVVGQLGTEGLIGAVAIGAVMFSFLFWAFGFLKQGTTGFTSQANGAGDRIEISAILIRAFIIGAALGLLLLATQTWTRAALFWWFALPHDVEGWATTYFDIRIWSAPATFLTYAVLGWLVGLQRTGYVMLLQIFLNGSNIALDLFFVMGLGMTVDGVALATVIAQWATLLLSLAIVYRLLPVRKIDQRTLFEKNKFIGLAKANINIMLRTLSLIYAFAFFNRESARLGTVNLDANAVLLQFVSFAAYALDGFAHAVEGLCGAAIGAKSRAALRDGLAKTTLWAFLFACLFSFLFWVFGGTLIDLLTTNETVRVTARTYLPWLVLYPLVSVWSFQLDGLYFAAVKVTQMRNAMIFSLIVYLVTAWLLIEPFGNHGLWMALTVLALVRAASLTFYYPAIETGLTKD
jgi:MATE family multidrug resistance protein